MDEAIVVAGADCTEPESWPLGAGEVVAFSARSPAKSTPNEDAALIVRVEEDTWVLAVADGMGGGPSGERAAALAVDALRQTVLAAARDGTLVRAAVIDGFELANERVRELRVGAGTTLAAVEIQGGVVRPYHVGDSAIFVVGQRGRIKHASIAHSPVGYAVESGLLDEEDALTHDDRHLVSNVVGADDMRIEIGPSVELAARDSLLLATDGLGDNLSVDEILDVVRVGPLVSAVASLAARARRRMAQPSGDGASKPDDITLLAVRRTRAKA